MMNWRERKGKLMSVQCKSRKQFVVAGVLFLMIFLCIPVRASAEWKRNSNGTYSYYQDGELQKKRWIGDYYVNAKGVRQTGWLKKGGKRYYFRSNGKVLKSTWFKLNGKMYYAGPDGALLTDGKYKIGDYYYGFDEQGVQLRGKTVIDGKTYFFGLLKGQMQVKKWIKTGNKYYYYGKNGVMATNKWVGKYYVNKKGVRTNKVKTEVSDASSEETSEIQTTNTNVESTYYTDPAVDDQTLLAAIIYCEAGNQAYAGQVAVGMVIMNRVYSPLFPSTIKEVVYQKTQFAPARDGSLTRMLTNPLIVTSACRNAAAEVLAMYANYTAGQTLYLNTGKKTISFPYLFFMTKPAYERLGLTSKTKKIGDHVFFKTWTY